MSRDMNLLHPELQKKFHELENVCRSAGLTIKNTSTYRDVAEQEDCVRRGTSSVHYPNSMHNWGVAVDFCRNDGTGAYNDKDGFFTHVGRLAESIGLIWGGSFSRPDKPHLQLADWGKTADILKAKYKKPSAFMASWSDKSEGGINVPVPAPLPSPVPDLKIGAEVIVTGTIYGNGKGSGGSIRKKGDTMYIVDYAGANYPHCYGVAKTQGGTRQGWAAPDILTTTDQENAGPAPYREWAAICNEPATNVRTGPGVDNPILNGWPKLGVGNEVDVIGEGMAQNGKLWYKLRIAGVHTGWVYGGFLDRR